MAFEDTLIDFDTLDFTLEDLEQDSEPNPLFSSSLYDFSTLCIPDDPIQDIFFSPPTFTNTNTTPSTPEQKEEVNTKKRGFEDEKGLSWRKKQRSKRNSGRVWNSRIVLPVKTRCCGHCGTDKTPQWRQGPLGPKTLCNACGVRYKSGRLVPEYRPIASPTFDSRRHSNSHRKIVRMRMTNEL